MDNKITESVPKKPFRAALTSLIMGAGAGQIYNGQIFKGIVMVILFLVPIGLAANEMFNIYMRYLSKIMAGDLNAVSTIVDKVTNSAAISSYSGFAAILWVISIIDAFYYAFLYNKKIYHEKNDAENSFQSSPDKSAGE